MPDGPLPSGPPGASMLQCVVDDCTWSLMEQGGPEFVEAAVSAHLDQHSHRDYVATIMALRGQLALYERTRTLGGPPPGYHRPGAWTGVTLPPPSTADDPTAPPLYGPHGSAPRKRDDLA